MGGKWICAQIGAREHYAVARALQQRDKLVALYTDFWAGKVIRKLGKQKAESGNLGGVLGPLRSLAGRFHPELEGAEVRSWNVRAVWEKLKAETLKAEIGSRKKKAWGSGPYGGFIEVGRRFAIRVREELEQKQKAESRKQKTDWIFFAYDTGALEALEWCREHGVKTVLNQMDPNRVEVELVREEEKRWPGWQAQSVQVPEEYFCRREREWKLADRVVVNSDFCREALVKQGVAREKLVVVPLCFEIDDRKQKAESRKQSVQSVQSVDGQCSDFSFQLSAFSFSKSSPLRVLFLGQVILRKGIQYLIEAARLLEGVNIRFDVVGPIGISQDAVRSAPRNVVFHGRTTRDSARDWYRQADLFVLPTLSDGFAITQLEAMAYGVPVVATPCCGAVVSDGVDGFIVPPRDAGALVKTFQRYLVEPGLLKGHRTAALEKAKQFSLDRLAANLLALEASLTER